MRYVITGHRLHKLKNYDINWIKGSIEDIVQNDSSVISLAYSGMASGVDLWFCESCLALDVPYIACIPFEEQSETMGDEEKAQREYLIGKAKEVKDVRNSFMVEHCDIGIVIWDGNKGGTHNVLQQLVEKNKCFYWINPVKMVVWKCF